MAFRDLNLEMVRPNVPASPTGNSETRYRVTHEGRELGVWRDPEHSAARFLLDNGLAERGDTIRTFRGQALCMTGSVGRLAGRRSEETDKYFRTVKWTPFPERALLAGRPSDDDPGSAVAPRPRFKENPAWSRDRRLELLHLPAACPLAARRRPQRRLPAVGLGGLGGARRDIGDLSGARLIVLFCFVDRADRPRFARLRARPYRQLDP